MGVEAPKPYLDQLVTSHIPEGWERPPFTAPLAFSVDGPSHRVHRPVLFSFPVHPEQEEEEEQ
jgi:hypothetical protein